MPYTPQEQRNLPRKDRMVNVGNLTYDIQQLIQEYLRVAIRTDRDQAMRYQYLCEAKAALLGAYDDFQERVVKPYEARKCEENGDVWDAEVLNA